MSSTKISRPPPPTHILETCIYVRSMTASTTFYQTVLGLTPQLQTPRITTFPLGTTTLILFQLGLTSSDSTSERGTVPGHGPDERTVEILTETRADPDDATDISWSGNLHTHFCLAVESRAEVESWERYLRGEGVTVRGTMDWERGGRSVYFEDVDGHVGEIGSRGIWEHW